MLNKVTLIGNLGADPEIRNLNNGSKVAGLRLATSESWKDKTTGERKEKTEWHTIAVFNDGLIGVIEKYLHKGSKVYVEGKLQTRKWTDKDGADRYSTEVILQGFDAQLIMLDGKPAGTDSHNTAKSNGFQPQPADLGGDEIPFVWLLPLGLAAMTFAHSLVGMA